MNGRKLGVVDDSGAQRCTIVLVDNQPLSRLGLASALQQSGLHVIGEADDARAGFRLIEAHHPQVAILALWLPRMDGIAAIRDLQVRAPRTKLVLFTASRLPRDAADALAAGAAGYILRTESVSATVAAVRGVCRGERYLSPELADVMAIRTASAAVADPLAALSARERDVFALVVRGLTNAEIASELCISTSTVDSHRRHINEKLGCHNTVELFVFAVRNALLRQAAVQRLARPVAGTLPPR